MAETRARMSEPIDELPADLQASVDAAIESMKQEELMYARTFARIWEEGFAEGMVRGDSDRITPQVDNPYMPALKVLEAELGEGDATD